MQEDDRGFWLAHVGGVAGAIATHVLFVAFLLAFRGDAAGASAVNMPMPPELPAVQARLVKLGRPRDIPRTRRETLVATAPDTGIALSRTNREETKTRPIKAQPSKTAAVDDALARTLRRAAEVGEQGSTASGEGSPDGVEGGEIDAAEAREIDLYYSMLQRLFRQNFRVPATVENAASMRCRVRVMINRDLSVGTPQVVSSSHDPTFDQSAVAAARAVNTVPPPPPEIADQVLGRSISVNYRGSSN